MVTRSSRLLFLKMLHENHDISTTIPLVSKMVMIVPGTALRRTSEFQGWIPYWPALDA